MESGLIIFLALLILIIVGSFFLWRFTNDKNTNKLIVIGTIFAAIGTIGALFFLNYQSFKISSQIDYQIKTYEIDNRPYLYIEVDEFEVNTGKGNYNDPASSDIVYGGVEFKLKNKGKIPAGDIDISFKYTSDQMNDPEALDRYLKNNDMQMSIVVFPEQIFKPSKVKCQMGNTPKMIHIWILVKYRGLREINDSNRDKIYWHLIDQLYFIRDDQKSYYLIWNKAYWDRNSNENHPEYNVPNWRDQEQKMKKTSGLPL